MAFSEGATVVDANGGVTEINGTSEKTSAESHTAGRLRDCPKRSPVLTLGRFTRDQIGPSSRRGKRALQRPGQEKEIFQEDQG